jgi:hypothetical protein
MLGVVSGGSGKQQHVVHAADEAEKWFLMFEGALPLLQAFGDKQKLQVVCVTPDSNAASAARHEHRRRNLLLPLEVVTWERFAGIFRAGEQVFSVESRSKDVHALWHGAAASLEPGAFIILGDLDFSAEQAAALRPGHWTTDNFLKCVESGVRNVAKSGTTAILFHVPGRRAVVDLPEGSLDRKQVPGGCLAPAIMVGASLVSTAAALLVTLCFG